jgi:3-deoxy-D-manno-octulosonate 8-phosphate phosphatase (KDO 8-P phosphatase)
MLLRPRAAAKAAQIKYLLLDVDGVMTDGGLYYSAEGHELKRFDAQDGYGIVMLRDAGIDVGIISGRSTPIIDARAKVLKIADVYHGADDKVKAMREIQERVKLKDSEFAYMADDLFDLPLLRVVGLSAAPSNGRPEVRRAVDVVTSAHGGGGAVRELVDFILASKRRVARAKKNSR